ncbi:leucyl aminopeptidase [Thermomicrobiaceae bacterium CFH 74404]|uniref:Probable cytosol aminopeptidase n=1 Tax=Thermalbibacter longus TaxID=2951981 RepID=A0AA42BAU6_9BACT|nr:leucyl aminopeptidase [Thermalbibacter longus]MCM8750137.1 leucyl aminopeptidase [Thermalbibacter longus]
MTIRFTAERRSPAELTDTLLVPVEAGGSIDASIQELDRILDGKLCQSVGDLGLTGRVGQVTVLPTWGQLPAQRLVIAGIGSPEARTADDIRRAWGAAAQAAAEAGARTLYSPLPAVPGLDPERVCQAAVEGAGLGTYRFLEYRTRVETTLSLEQVIFLATAGQVERGIERGRTAVEAVCLARDLVNRPGNELPPERLAGIAWEIAERAGLECRVYDRGALEELGAGAILAVGQGSRHEPHLIHLVYRPAGQPLASVGLVGKGVTFDTGGISIKPAEGMERMKGDMAGAAAVIGVMQAVATLGLPIAVHGVVAAAENMPDGAAFRPGDILRALNGKTIEVISTDAEGRLLLADALTYTAQQGVDVMIDLATLTGACVVALGKQGTGLFGTDQDLVDALVRAGQRAGEKLWPMPLWDEYRELLKSEHADIKNTGGRWGGAINAALFLREFTEGVSWAHLDIAGPAWAERGGPLGPAGGTGHGVRTLLYFLEEYAARS